MRPTTFVFGYFSRYAIFASRIVRPNTIFRVIVNILESEEVLEVRASLRNKGIEVTSANSVVNRRSQEILLLKVKNTQ